jgi:hypothetical protein
MPLLFLKTYHMMNKISRGWMGMILLSESIPFAFRVLMYFATIAIGRLRTALEG